MYFYDHAPPTSHGEYAEHHAAIVIGSNEVLVGSLPTRAQARDRVGESAPRGVGSRLAASQGRRFSVPASSSRRRTVRPASRLKLRPKILRGTSPAWRPSAASMRLNCWPPPGHANPM